MAQRWGGGWDGPRLGAAGAGWGRLAFPQSKVGLEWEAWSRGGFAFGFFCACLGDARAGHTPSPGSEGRGGTLHREGFKVGQGNGTGCSAI